ncbi:hypothetical protein CKM354_000991500 [Cercospora kikuchii]|uniref:Amine oxidase n=1 Tax=Cercospora kikuchii TaxID=84275 RepID=A0A9P3CUC2_9PEZI|nr:uncharacterized protein CKM354_000991500 [Cercospora kikuchii]GIZ46805.1 hypothetical protein CKM354_000991500 [Cercospora kikuchii]
MLDAIVIGAGLSGLQAARSLQEAGLQVIVLEARNRVGGKVWSVPLASGRGVVDLGAAWVNDQLQPRITKYLKRWDLKRVEQRLGHTAIMQSAEGDISEFPHGIMPEFSEEEKKNLGIVRDHIQAESLKAGRPESKDDAVSLDQYVRDLGATDKTIKMVNLWARVMHGVESTEESAAFFIDYCRKNQGLLSIRADDKTGGNYQRLHRGTQSIANGLHELVGKHNVYFDSPVKSVEDNRAHVVVTIVGGKMFKARKVIISVPSTMYQDLTISPPLPAGLQELADNATMGDYNKMIVCYNTPWWRDSSYNGFFMSYSGPSPLARDTSVEEVGLYCLTCFVNGDLGRKWSKLPPHERRATILKQLAKIYKAGPDSEVWRPIEVFDQIWKHEQYSKGALVPITKIGDLTKHADVYGKPVGNIHFCGTEYATEWKGYMEGALCSGENVAKEVLNAVGSDARPRL